MTSIRYLAGANMRSRCGDRVPPDSSGWASRACFTAVFGGYDLLKPFPVDAGMAAICFTDDAELEASGWTIGVVEPLHEHSRMSAEYFKVMGHVAMSEFDQTLWIDASLQIDEPTFPEEALSYLECGDLALFLHPDRACIYPEAEKSAGMLKYQDQAVHEQVAHYRDEGHPEDAGLYAATVIARNQRSPRIAELNERWWDENLRWTYQDQLSLPPVLRELGIRPTIFAQNLYHNRWFHFTPHTRQD
jgi:hypothetical protein